MKNRTVKELLFLYAKGVLMGAADSVPGVSGGTIAFITNIYEELIFSVRSIDFSLFTTLKRSGIKACWKQVNGSFLATLLAGIVSSLLLLANLVLYLLEYHEQLLLSFFCGLILASTYYMARQITVWNLGRFILVLTGIILCVSLSFIPIQQVEPSLWYVFIGGALSICAMILPGISGAFILLLLGLYAPVLSALKSFEFIMVVVFIAGCASGLLSFTRVLTWLFEHHKNSTLAMLTGVLCGSLYSLWPWQRGTAFIENKVGELEAVQFVPVLPGQYTETYAQDVNLFLCAGLFGVGFILVLWFESFAGKKI